jgi:hypothetical protein
VNIPATPLRERSHQTTRERLLRFVHDHHDAMHHQVIEGADEAPICGAHPEDHPDRQRVVHKSSNSPLLSSRILGPCDLATDARVTPARAART